MGRFIVARFILPFLLGGLPCLLTDFILRVSQGRAAEKPYEKSIDNLIVDLASDRFENREAATCALKERVEALPALRKVRQSADLEVRRRVELILTALERKRAIKGLSKAKSIGKAGRAVEVADRLAIAAKYGIAGDEGWESLTQLTDQVITRTDPYFPSGWKFYRHREFPAGVFRQYVKLANPKEIAEPHFKLDLGRKLDDPGNPQYVAGRKLLRETHGKLLLRGEELTLTGRVLENGGIINSMIASSGEIEITGAVQSVVIAGAHVKQISRLQECVLICDGDVEFLTGWNAKGVIIARGKVTCKEGQFRNCLIRSGHTLILPNGSGVKVSKTIELKDGNPDPVAFVKFFELTDVGLTAEDLPGRNKVDAAGVRLTDVRKGSPFAAGLRAGDVIIAIEDKETPTTETFRRVVRRKLAEGGPVLIFTVRRSGKTLDVPVPVKD